ncbi:MAG TPA: 16S rRNA (guanine(527)-N(7))-methyltransferase RsmG [Dehalococcoidia bacterium]|nr:16S rRNA (guanine(527)-N(7))-methyltransferase RsmG [Dehalococcoidia bacterium]
MLAVLASRAAELGLDLSAEQLDLFERYADLLLSSGRRAGVTAIATKERVEQRHFVESLAVAKALLDAGLLDRASESRVLDLGTGGGFPGLPVKMLLPQLLLTLLDARERTTAFLRELLRSLGIDGVEVVTARGEDAGRDPAYRERFDVVLARALAPLPVLLELTLPFLRVGGHLATPKGSGALREIGASEHALDILGGSIASSEALRLPDGGHAQRLVLIRKTAVTPARYPRRAGIPKKRPL